jgi:hypothetical protein
MKLRFWLLAGLAVAMAGCRKAEEQEASPSFVPARVVSTYLAMLEKPTATRCLLAGTRCEAYREFFVRAGLAVDDQDTGKGRYDIVFIAGETKLPVKKLAEEWLSSNGVLARVTDVREKRMEVLAEEFRELGEVTGSAHLWMPGIEDWIVVGRKTPVKIKLSAMMDIFSREGGFDDLSAAQCLSLPELFASYAGELEAAMPAFGNVPGETLARPQFFVTKDVPDINWIDVGADVEPDILEEMVKEVRSMQIIRRLVLEGGMLADEQKIDEATDAWSRAALRNPHDPMLVDRLERLWKNADAFFRVGNFALAAKCYETYLMIRPNDWQSAEALSFCLMQLGKRELAEEVHKKAMRLRDGNAAR